MNKKLKKSILSLSVMSLLLGTVSTNAFAARAYSNCYSTGGSSTTISNRVGNSLSASCKFIYVSNELSKTLSVYRSTSITGPSSLTVSAGSQHAVCTAKRTEGTHGISGTERYWTTTVAYR